jgi:hypothetical protein
MAMNKAQGHHHRSPRGPPMKRQLPVTQRSRRAQQAHRKEARELASHEHRWEERR